MATGTHYPFALSLLLFLFVSCSPIHPTASTTDHVPVSVSAKAAAVQYWNRVVGSNSHPPSVLLAHVSNTSPLNLIASLNEIGVAFVDFNSDDVIRMVKGEDASSFSPDATSMYGHSRAADADMRKAAGGSDDKHAISFSPDATSMYGHSRADKHAISFSPDASSMYGHSRAADMRRAAGGFDGKHAISFSPDATSMYGHSRAADAMSHDGDHGVFFRESQLKKGTTMPTADFGGERPHQDFLPRNIASMIPLSADAVMKLFRVPADSSMGNAVITTVELCKEAPLEGETRRCVTSAEDMINYVVSSLGAKPNGNITAKSTSNSNGMGSSVLIGGVKAVNKDKLGRVVSCHQASFPYLLYQCHSVPETKLYEVEILDPETRERINLATAICHFDTSRWSPGFAAFVALGSERGTEVCHWIYPRNIAWTVAAE